MLFIRSCSGYYKTLNSSTRIRGGGWLLVMPEVENRLLSLLPYVKLTIDGDVVVGVEDDIEARNNPPLPPDPIPDAQADTDALIVDHEFRLTLLELGVI